MKSAMLQLTGNGGTLNSVVIANTVKMSGNSTLRIDPEPNANHLSCFLSRWFQRHDDDDDDGHGRGRWHDWRGHHGHH